jgi:putative sterol carrier protein
MPKYPFLSAEWTASARSITEAHVSQVSPDPANVLRMNLLVTEVPFGDEDVKAYLDTSSGLVELDLGHLESADLSVTLDYATAKAMLIDQNPQAGMQAFMAGKIRVEGDMTKLLMLQGGQSHPGALAVAEELREITA